MIDEEVNVFLEHHGVKGQRWGIRKDRAISVAKAIGRGTVTTAKVTGRTAAVVGRGTVVTAKAVGKGTKATFNWTREHKKTAVTIAAGVAAVGIILAGRHQMKIRQVRKATRLATSNFEASKRLLDARRNIRMSELGKIASETAPGSARREAAFREMNFMVLNYNDKLKEIAIKNGIDKKSLWELH